MRKVSPNDIHRAYEIFQGLFFESSWHGEENLELSMASWARESFPRLHEEWADEGPEALEASIREEEGSEEIAGFINSLPGPTRRVAIAGIYQDVASVGDPNAEDVLERLDLLLDRL